MVYHIAEAFMALRDPDIHPFLKLIGLDKMAKKFPFRFDLYTICQFYNNFKAHNMQAHIPKRVKEVAP